ncbi:MAG TPA: serine hydrolase domain-containing protein [Cellvibrionaceae bacterium]
MKLSLSVLFVLLLGACSPKPATTTPATEPTTPQAENPQAMHIDTAHIDQVLGAFVEKDKLVGVSALIYQQGEEAYFGTFGMADREANKPMQRDTIVRLYSMTKPVTGVALMILFEEGKFALDDPLAKYLPEFAEPRVYVGMVDGEPAYEPAHRPISVYDILRHSAGFAAEADSTPVGQLYAKAEPFNREHTLAEMIKRLSQVPLVFQPGRQWLYGPSVDVQARLVEVLSGQSFTEFLQTRLFDPLQMHDTGHFVPEEKRERLAQLYQWYEDDRFFPANEQTANSDYFKHWPLRRGGSGLTSTLDDYMRFARMLNNGGELDGVRILQPETLALMTTDALGENVPERSWLPNKGQVGFGINFAVRLAPPANTEEASGMVGEFFWDGYSNVLFWVDPQNDLTALLFTQYIPFGSIDLHKPFRDAVYLHHPKASALTR